MCTVLPPPGVYPITVKYIISYHITSYHIIWSSAYTFTFSPQKLWTKCSIRAKSQFCSLWELNHNNPSRTAEFNLSVRTLRDEHCLLRIRAAELVSTRDNYSCARNLITLFATYIGTRGFRTTSQISTAAKHGSIEVIKTNYVMKKGVGKEIYPTYRSSSVEEIQRNVFHFHYHQQESGGLKCYRNFS